MISILKNSKLYKTLAIGGVLGYFFILLSLVNAAAPETQTISVSPTLFNMKAAPGQTWKSEIRVINVNDFAMTVYPQVVNFSALGEDGRVNLEPILSATDTKGRTLADWIFIVPDPIVVAPQKSATIPFTITLPDDAPPGSHHAAILIGTKPPLSSEVSSHLQTAQFVTALVFLRVAGDVVESGEIRDFSTSHFIIQSPEIDFSLRFENKGNTDVQPQGDITIYNMWGEQRGTIPINQQTNYGNVVANSIRQFMFTWKGETSIFDIGRYKAIATLGFGDEKKQFSNRTTYFWIIPFKQISVFLLVLMGLFVFFSWAVKLYIRRMLLLAGIDPKATHHIPATYISKYHDEKTVAQTSTKVNVDTYHTVTSPVRFGIADLKQRLTTATKFIDKLRAVGSFVYSYRLFFLFILVILLIVCVVSIYLHAVHTKVRQYEVTVATPGSPVVFSSEDIFYNQLRIANPSATTSATTSQTFTLSIVNRSGEVGRAAQIKFQLENEGYVVDTLSSDMDQVSKRTVIVYDQDLSELALQLSKDLTGALMSATSENNSHAITIYVGSDTISK